MSMLLGHFGRGARAWGRPCAVQIPGPRRRDSVLSVQHRWSALARPGLASIVRQRPRERRVSTGVLQRLTGVRRPWNFETSEYESRKYGRTLGVLEGRRLEGAESAILSGCVRRVLAPQATNSSRGVSRGRSPLPREACALPTFGWSGAVPRRPRRTGRPRGGFGGFATAREQMSPQRRLEECRHGRRAARVTGQGDEDTDSGGEVHEHLEAHTRLKKTAT